MNLKFLIHKAFKVDWQSQAPEDRGLECILLQGLHQHSIILISGDRVVMNRTWIAISSKLRFALIAGSLSVFAATHNC